MVATRSQHTSSLADPDAAPVTMLATSRAKPPKSILKTRARAWVHTPSHLTLAWLLISLPLVFWDTGYVLGRPHTMPGGSFHSPLYKPYALYGTVDYIYGFPAWNAHNGFTAAQGVLNLIESGAYVAYLWIVYRFGREEGPVEGRGAPTMRRASWLGQARCVGGREGGVATLIGFSAAIITLSKTVLYGLNEYFSGFENIGHNDALSLIFLWIIPNGAWLVGPTYMSYVFGAEILEGLATASDEASDSLISKALTIKDE